MTEKDSRHPGCQAPTRDTHAHMGERWNLRQGLTILPKLVSNTSPFPGFSNPPASVSLVANTSSRLCQQIYPLQNPLTKIWWASKLANKERRWDWHVLREREALSSPPAHTAHTHLLTRMCFCVHGRSTFNKPVNVSLDSVICLSKLMKGRFVVGWEIWVTT